MIELSLWVSQIISGLNSAVLVTLVALGISLIFGVGRIVNLAHGSFYMLGAFIMSTIAPFKDGVVWFGLATILTAIFVGLIAGVCEVLLLRRIYKKGAHLQIMMTFGLLLCLNSSVELIWGTEYRHVDRPEALADSLIFGDLAIPTYNIWLFVNGAIVLVFLWILMQFTSWGRKLRATSADREMLSALGTDVNKIAMEVFILAGALAGFAGALAAPLFAISLQLGFESSLNAFIVVVVGGLGSLLGSLWASLLICELQAVSVLVYPKITGFLPSAIMLLALLVRYGRSSQIYGLEKNDGDHG